MMTAYPFAHALTVCELVERAEAGLLGLRELPVAEQHVRLAAAVLAHLAVMPLCDEYARQYC